MDNITMFLGYDLATWRDMWTLYVFENKEKPSDLCQLREYWHKKIPYTPNDSLRVGLVLSQAYNENINSDPVVSMIEAFLVNKL